MTVVAVCRFPGSSKDYHYFCDAEITPGMRAYVDTRRGKAEVEIVDVIERSDRASAHLLAVMGPKEPEPGRPF